MWPTKLYWEEKEKITVELEATEENYDEKLEPEWTRQHLESLFLEQKEEENTVNKDRKELPENKTFKSLVITYNCLNIFTK